MDSWDRQSLVLAAEARITGWSCIQSCCKKYCAEYRQKMLKFSMIFSFAYSILHILLVFTVSMKLLIQQRYWSLQYPDCHCVSMIFPSKHLYCLITTIVDFYSVAYSDIMVHASLYFSNVNNQLRHPRMDLQFRVDGELINLNGLMGWPMWVMCSGRRAYKPIKYVL